MRRGMLGQPRQPPIIAHGFLRDGRVQPLAAGAEEKRLLRRGIGPMRQPSRHGRAHRRQHRHEARLAPLAKHPQRRVLTGAWRIANIKRQRLGNAQPAAIEQGKQRDIPRCLELPPLCPGRGMHQSHLLAQRDGLLGRDGPRHRAGQARAAQPGQRQGL